MRSCLGGKYTSKKSPKNPHRRLYLKKKKKTLFKISPQKLWASLVAQMVKNLPTMQGTWVQFLDREDPLEKEMAIHSSILAWRILWTEEPGRLESRGSQRVGHDWATFTHTTQRFSWQLDTFPPFSISLPSLIFALTHAILKVSVFIHLLRKIWSPRHVTPWYTYLCLEKYLLVCGHIVNIYWINGIQAFRLRWGGKYFLFLDFDLSNLASEMGRYF